MKKFNHLVFLFLFYSSHSLMGQNEDLSVYYNCNTQCIDIEVFGGVSPYQVEWYKWDEDISDFILLNNWPQFDLPGDNGLEDLCNIFNMPELSIGTYSYVVHDKLCGRIQGDIEILTHPLEIDLASTASCNDDGSITIDVTYGTIPYEYLWSDGSTFKDRVELLEGEYTVTVTDNRGCTATSSTYIKNADPIEIEGMPVQIWNSSCSSNTGKIEILYKPVGGNSPFQYFWSNGYEGKFNYDIPAGSYEVTVVDAEGCTASKVYDVPGEGQPFLGFMKSKNTCAGTAHGLIEMQFVPEVGPLSYAVTSGVNYEEALDNWLVLSDLEIGEYCVTVTDIGNGCFTEVCSTIEEIETLIELKISNNAYSVKHSCDYGPNGNIFIAPTGGVGQYTFQWSNGETTKNIDQLLPGIYSVTVSDQCFNQVSKEFEVLGTEADMNINAEVRCVSTKTGTGSIKLKTTGSNGPFSYSWSNYNAGPNNLVSTPGAYTVTVYDSNGCSISETFNVGETEDDLAVNVQVVDLSECQDINEFEATANVTGGVAPYSYEWNDGNSEKSKILPTNATDYQPSTKQYSLTVTDACGYRVIYQNNFTCNDICGEDCIKLYKGGFYSQPQCTDVCDNYDASGLELWCDKIKVKCECDDDVVRNFNWGALTGTSGTTTTFKGKNVIDGETSYDIVDAGGWATGWVKNEATGCVSFVSTYIPGECFNLWNWLTPDGQSTGGGLSTGPPFGTEKECISYTSEIDDENCQTIWVCVDPPENDFPDIIDTDEEFCQQEYAYTYNGTYHVFESCYCHSKAEIYSTEEDPGFCACEGTLGIVGIDPDHSNYACEMNPVSIEYDSAKRAFIYFSSYYNSHVVKPEVTKYNGVKRPIDISNIAFVNYSIEHMVLDKDDNVILHVKDSLLNSKILKFDEKKNQLWYYDFIRIDKQKIYEIKITETNGIILTGYDENYNTFETILDEEGNEIQTTVASVLVANSHTIEDVVFSKNDSSYISLINSDGVKYIHLVKESIIWQLNIPFSWSVVKYLKDENGNYVIFYNYDQSFIFNGSTYNLFGQNSIGFLVVTPTGTIIDNYTINYTSTQILTDIELGRDNYIALMGYYSNHENVDLSYLKDNPELCSFLVGLDLKYHSIAQRTTKEEDKILDIIPNPTSDFVDIVYLSSTTEIVEIKVKSLTGKSVLNQRTNILKGNNTINLSLDKNLPAGVYSVNIHSTLGIVSKLVIKI